MTGLEAALLERLRAGERAALRQLIERHHEFLLNMVGPLVGRDAAEDVVQEAWIKVLAALSRFEGRSSLRSWLAQIALNTARSWRRSHRQDLRTDRWGEDPGSPLAARFDADGQWAQPPGPWHHSTPEALLTAAELRACLQKHLEHLPPDQRTVLWLRDIEGAELADIAAITELTEGNVRVLLHRGRQRLQVMIERFEREGTC
jgi:RNA polymerase sigma-70 factor (ECF subfamily)